MKALTAFFVRRPLLVRLIMVFVFVAGGLALKYQTFEMFPTIDLGIVTVTTFKPGASPEDVELSITVPLEEEILEVDGIRKLYSSSMEGISVITVRMDPDAEDPSEVLGDIQEAVDRGKADLPDSLLHDPVVEELSTRKVPVVEVYVTGAAPESSLRAASVQLANGLRELSGVAGVEKLGYRDREVKIFVDPIRMQHLALTYDAIESAIQRRNVRDSGGSLESFVAEKKVLTVGQFADPQDVADVIIKGKEPGNHVRIHDVADVILDYEDWQERMLIDEEMSILLLPRKKPSADGLKASAEIRDFVHDAQKNAPPGIRYVLANDMSRFTHDMLDTLTSNALLGLLLLFIVLLLFFNLKLSFWVAVGLPFSVSLTLLIMPVAGMGVNLFTIMMLILLLGMLVDDAIVTSESIYALREAGMEGGEASIEGRAMVASPVIVSTLTTILAFAPIAFMGGLEGKFMWYVPAMVAVVLGASLFECQFILPCHLAHGRGRAPRPKRWFAVLQRYYERLMTVNLRYRYLTVLAFIVGFAVILGYGAKTLKFNLYPETDIDTFNVKVELPEGSSFEHTAEKTIELAQLVKELIPEDDLLNIAIKIGQHDTDLYGAVEGKSPSWSLITVYMLPQGQRQTNSNNILKELRRRFAAMEGFLSLQVEPLKDTPVPGKPVQLEVIGNDEGRHDIADRIVDFLSGHEGVTDAWTSYKPGKEIVQIDLDHEAMAARSLTTADITQAVRIAFDGLVVDEMQTVDERIRFRLQFRPGTKGRLETLKNLMIMNPNGRAIPLSSVTDLRSEPGEAAIIHYFGQRTTTVYAEIDRGVIDVASINSEVADYLDREQFRLRYPNVRFWFGGELEQQEEAMGNIEMAFLICVLSIFFVLVLLFNSITQPLLILAVLPFGLTGVIIGFATQGIEMSMMALFGVLGLVGVLVNDSIVLVDYLNKGKSETTPFLTIDEMRQRTARRLRPIMITSLTTCAGLFPTAYGLAGSNPFITPMVMAMFWGILFGTLSSLVLLPSLYAVEQDVRKVLGRKRVRNAE